MSDPTLESIAAWYKWFADNEADGQSPLWASLGRKIANDTEVLRFLAEFPHPKRQPNLLLASYRSLFGLPDSWITFRNSVLSERTSLAARMMERSTQTNEPGRCATLLPLLARLPQPLAILEVGAAAGLCLLPDRYGYDYGRCQILPPNVAEGPVFTCTASNNTPLPDKLPEIAWRAGLDLNPLDVSNSGQMDWLEMLVWPGQEQRAIRLKKSISVARIDPPRVMRGDLMTDLDEIMAEIPAGLTKVIFHSAVLNYLPTAEARAAFSEKAMSSADYWISNESPLVLPDIASDAPPPSPGSFMLALNGQPMAWTSPHGFDIQWIETD